MSKSTEKFRAALHAAGISSELLELPGSTRTAELAAHAVGCNVGQIAKSLIFEGQQTHSPVLVIASGANRVDQAKLEPLVGEAMQLAGPDYVREVTGFAIGGVPPFGHAQSIPTYIDRDLMQYERIWAAAGTPQSVFEIEPSDLVRAASAEVVEVK